MRRMHARQGQMRSEGQPLKFFHECFRVQEMQGKQTAQTRTSTKHFAPVHLIAAPAMTSGLQWPPLYNKRPAIPLNMEIPDAEKNYRNRKRWSKAKLTNAAPNEVASCKNNKTLLDILARPSDAKLFGRISGFRSIKPAFK